MGALTQCLLYIVELSPQEMQTFSNACEDIAGKLYLSNILATQQQQIVSSAATIPSRGDRLQKSSEVLQQNWGLMDRSLIYVDALVIACCANFGCEVARRGFA